MGLIQKTRQLKDVKGGITFAPPSAPSGYLADLLPSLDTVAFILAALTAGGGTTGYVRTGSVPSIAAGVSVGALYALGGYRISNRQPYGVELALLASVVLAGSSIPRAMKSGKPLPIGLSLLAAYGLYSFGSAWSSRIR
ncbi:unnamed protein product [Aureobasidium uvarum]|uniref:Uncharacterized protein n=1 Tax=Aureobasidium uvarum TaxID=2773716 RepID=A0A9N8PUB2_9PEZI|nr:unnamed protein product [Aureobasidium uvarum]